MSASFSDIRIGMKGNPASSPLGKGRGESKGVVGQDLQKLRQATGQVVGSVFFGTLLKTMRESKIKGTFGHGGRGEEVFSAQLDGILAEKMGESKDGGIADAMFRHLQKQQSLMSGSRPAMVGGFGE